MASGTLNFGMVLSVIDKATAPLRKVASVFGDLGGAAEKLKKSAETLRVARENVDDFTGRLKEGLASIAEPAREVQDALSRVAADAGPKLDQAAGDLDKLRTSALEWSKAHVQSSTAYIETAGLLIKSGLDESTAMKATEAALRASTATGKDAAEVATTLSILYGQMGDKTKDASVEFGRLGDVVTRASQTFTGFDAAQLADPLKDAIPAAKAAGVSVEQMVAILGTLNAAGIKGGESGAAFAGSLDTIKKASTTLGFELKKTSSGGLDLVGTLQGIEKKFGSIDKMTPDMAAKLQEAFGPAGFKLVAATLGQTDKLATSLQSVTNSAGAAADAAAKIEDSDTAQLQIAQQNIEALKVDLAAGLLPAVKELVPHIKEAVSEISGFVKEHPGVVAFVGTVVTLAIAVGSVLGPLLSLGGALASVGGFLLEAIADTALYNSITEVGLLPALGAATAEAWAFATALLANPITWIVLAIVALAAVIYVYWEPISGFFLGLWDKVKGGFQAAWNVILAVWSAVKSATSSVLDAVVGVWDRVVAYFQNAIAEIKAAFQVSFVGGIIKLLSYINPVAILVRIWSALLPWMIGLWMDLQAAISRALVAIGVAIANGAQAAWEAIPRAFSALGDFFAQVWTWIKDGFADGILNGLARLFLALNPLAWIVGAFNALVEWLFGLSLLDAATHIIDTLIDGWKTATGAVLGFFAGLLDSIWEFFGPGIQNDLGSVGGFFSDAWESIKNIVAGGVDAVLDLISFLNPLSMIVAAWSLLAPYLASVWDSIKALVSRGIDAALAALERLNPITPLTTLWSALPGYIDSIWTTLKGLVDQGVAALMAALAALNPLTPIMQAWDAVTQWFSTFSLAEAGSNIVNTIVDGMKAAASAPVDAMKGIVQDVRNLLPFSPAKEGPLTDLDKVKLVETVADSVKPAPLVNAMTDVTGKTMTALQNAAPAEPLLAPTISPVVAPVTMPTFAEPPTPAMRSALSPASSSPAGSSAGVAGAAGGGTMQVSITINAGNDDKTSLDAFKQWIQDPSNARDVYVAIQRVAAHEDRKELG